MKLNNSKVSLSKIIDRKLAKQVKKFNSKGYFHQVEPYDGEYLKIKHEAYQKHRHNEDKQNNVYNLLPDRMRVGFYEMKGCNMQEPQKFIKKRRTLKSINNHSNQESRLQTSKLKTQQSQKLVECFFNKYMKRRQRLKTKSERTLVSIFEQIRSNSHSVQSNSRQISHHSFKTSERCSRILSLQHKNHLKTKYLSRQLHNSQKQNITIIAAYRDKIKSRKNRIKTIQ